MLMCTRTSLQVLVETRKISYKHVHLLYVAVKTFSAWPTFPQLYAKGKLVGGADILMEMHRSGELVELLSELGIRSKLLDEPAPEAKK